MRPIGVLSLQGDFAAHATAVAAAGARALEVRTTADLAAADALILPGGESSAMLRLMAHEGLIGALADRIKGGMPVLATCAGVILLADRVSPEQQSLGVLDIDVTRNAYGRQVHSSVETLRVAPQLAPPETMEGVFIRAPRITRVGDGASVLAWRGEDPVVVVAARVVAATFHPELTGDRRVHDLFLRIVDEAAAANAGRPVSTGCEGRRV